MHRNTTPNAKHLKSIESSTHYTTSCSQMTLFRRYLAL
jgi:hypothetical protein